MPEAIVFRMEKVGDTNTLMVGGDRKVLYRIKNLGSGMLVINDKIDVPWGQTTDVWASELKVKSVTREGHGTDFVGSFQFLSA